ncbi:MAG: ribulose-phosphate 3-epimerase [Bacteroidetes bacterium]|nr:ribulose-phosphate 3-epimerase [Bacteroidota bacterium]
MKHLLAPSILTADFGKLGQEIQMLNQSDADWIHVDVMDGVFVPNISFGFHIIKTIKKLSTKPLDVHLMIVQPERYFQEFKNAGADLISFHYEASIHVHRSIQAIKELGIKAGVAINPHTAVNLLKEVLNDLDLVLVMTVNPGYGGQKFIENSYKKIVELKEMIQQCKSNTLIEVDGGVDLNNARKLVQSGVDVLVAGNSVFAAQNPLEAIMNLKELDS